MHLLIPAADGAGHLQAELERSFPAGVVEAAGEGLLLVKGLPGAGTPLPPLVFARQVLPEARLVVAPSIRGFADLLFEAVTGGVPEAAPWRLHLQPHYGQAGAGEHRCELIREALTERLKKQRRHLLRRLGTGTAPFGETESLVQLLLTEPDRGFLAVCAAPGPQVQRAVLSPFPKGEIPIASDRSAPSRAFAKLVEAEQRLGVAIGAGQRCVDLGASPGSWTYVALRRSARVVAVDRSPLREDLHRHPALEFREGDAFRFEPEAPVDWLLCDVIAAPERSIGLLLDWVEERWCRRFVVTIKFKGADDYPQLDRLKRELPPRCRELLLTRLCANKNEACALGEVQG